MGELWLYVQVALGIGAVIFVHELGHFLAARWCGVRVETFSLGFGPRLLAWRRGPTTYQLALLPLGGYVKMAGEEPAPADSRPGPDELRAKGVPARFFIYSGGVLMNVLFGVVVFPIALWMGVPFVEPRVGAIEPGGPAWRAGLEPGTKILAVNGRDVVGFDMLRQEVALAPPAPLRLLVQAPGETQARELVVEPEYDASLGARGLGIEPPLDPALSLELEPDSNATRAGLRSGDRLVSLHDSELPELPLPAQLELAMRGLQPLVLEVERGGERLSVRVEADASRAPSGRALLGVWPCFRRVVAVREDPLVLALGLRAGDRLLRVGGLPILREYDFERGLAAEADGQLRLRVLRDDRVLELSAACPDRAQRLALARFVAVDFETDSVIVPMDGSAAERAGLLPLDQIVSVNGVAVPTYAELRAQLVASRSPKLQLEVNRERAAGLIERLVVEAELAPPPAPTYGILGFPLAQYVYRAPNPMSAIRVGLESSWKFLSDSFTTLKRIALGQVSSDNIGGIITIGAVSYSWAAVGFAKLLFFLCMLSMNLAFINVLPIPVLDGGHLLFLLVEGLKGSPVSERVLAYSQVVGLVLLLSLIVFVTYNDLMRWVFS
jgi:regulator of sigma E protease